jgi:hypothetical protein
MFHQKNYPKISKFDLTSKILSKYMQWCNRILICIFVLKKYGFLTFVHIFPLILGRVPGPLVHLL